VKYEKQKTENKCAFRYYSSDKFGIFSVTDSRCETNSGSIVPRGFRAIVAGNCRVAGNCV